MTTALAQQTPATNPLAILAAAVERGADPEQLDKLLGLQERYERNEAAKAFSDALAEFQRLCPPVVKSREAGAGNFKYAYAGYEDVWKVAGPYLADLGISVSFSTDQQDKGILGTIFVRKGIHEVSRTMYLPLPGMRVNDSQQYGAAVKYVKRYLLEAALNIVTQGEPDDDAQCCYERITEEQAVKLREWLIEKNVNLPRFLEWAGVESLGDMPADKYPQAIEYLKRK
jgi:hypothetical protein